MIAKKLKTNRHHFYVPLGLLLGLVIIAAGLVLTSPRPVLGDDGPMCVVPPSGLVGWWPGDGNAKDITPHDHDGTLQGDTTFTSGEVGQAFSFDGDNDYVDIPNKPDLNIPSGTITVDAWINPAVSGQFYPSILSKGDVGNFKESYALFLTPNNTIGFLVNTNGMAGGRRIVFGVTLIPTNGNTWTFVAGTYDGTTVRVYVNGKLDGTVVYVGKAGINGTNNDVLIGRAERTGFGGDSFFNGAIDEVELFNRVLSGGTAAMSGGELGNIYKAGSAGKCKCQDPPAQAKGDMNDDDGHKSNVDMEAKRNCDDNGGMDFKDDSGEEMQGKNKSVAMSGNTAMVSGTGNLLDGTPVNYTAVLVGNQQPLIVPLIGPLVNVNLFSITWTTATGSIFHRSGVMVDGYAIVPLQ